MLESDKTRLSNMASADVMGFVQGLREPLDSTVQMISHALPDSVNQWAHKTMGSFAPMPVEIDAQITERKARYESTREAAGAAGFDVPYMVGNLAGTAPLLEFAPVAKGWHWIARTTNVLGLGYAYGTLDPITDDTRGFWEQKHAQGKIGAMFVGALAPLDRLATKLFTHVSEKIEAFTSKGKPPFQALELIAPPVTEWEPEDRPRAEINRNNAKMILKIDAAKPVMPPFSTPALHEGSLPLTRSETNRRNDALLLRVEPTRVEAAATSHIAFDGNAIMPLLNTSAPKMGVPRQHFMNLPTVGGYR